MKVKLDGLSLKADDAVETSMKEVESMPITGLTTETYFKCMRFCIVVRLKREVGTRSRRNSALSRRARDPQDTTKPYPSIFSQVSKLKEGFALKEGWP